MSTRYLAVAVDEPGHFELGIDGQPLPAHHLVAVAEADTHTDDGVTVLFPLPRVVTLLDTGVRLSGEPPFLPDLLAAHGWNVPETDLDIHPDATLCEVLPADPTTVHPAVEYHNGRPQPYYLAGLAALRERQALPAALNLSVATAVELITDQAAREIHPHQVEDLLFGAACQAVLERLDQLGVTLAEADDQLKRELLATMCVSIGEQLDLIRDRKTCRTCDAPATGEFEGRPVCANTGH